MMLLICNYHKSSVLGIQFFFCKELHADKKMSLFLTVIGWL